MKKINDNVYLNVGLTEAPHTLAPCGCILECPLHLSAPAMYEALKSVLQALPSYRFLLIRKKVVESISLIEGSAK